MTRQLDADRILEEWLAEIPSRLPDRVVDAIVAEVDRTPQRKRFSLPRREDMNRFALALGGAAAGLLVVVLGLGLFYNQPNLGGPGTTPLASPPATNMVTPGPTAEPSPEARQAPPTRQSLEPGRYFTFQDDYRYEYTVPATGWLQETGWVFLKEGDDKSGAVFAFWGEVSGVYADACQWSDNLLDPQPGPSADDLAEALAGLGDRQVSQPTDIVVDGYEGKHVQMRMPQDVDFADCDLGLSRSWANLDHHDPGEIMDMWILDLDDRRHVIFSVTYANTPEETRQQLSSIIESMEIEPANP